MEENNLKIISVDEPIAKYLLEISDLLIERSKSLHTQARETSTHLKEIDKYLSYTKTPMQKPEIKNR